MKCQSLFSGKNKKKYCLVVTEFAHKVVKVKTVNIIILRHGLCCQWGSNMTMGFRGQSVEPTNLAVNVIAIQVNYLTVF